MSNEYGWSRVHHTRRKLISADAAWPALALVGEVRGQPKPTVLAGWISFRARETSRDEINAFHDGMAALGWKAADQYVLEAHWGEGRSERMPLLAQRWPARNWR